MICLNFPYHLWPCFLAVYSYPLAVMLPFYSMCWQRAIFTVRCMSCSSAVCSAKGVEECSQCETNAGSRPNGGHWRVNNSSTLLVPRFPTQSPIKGDYSLEASLHPHTHTKAVEITPSVKERSKLDGHEYQQKLFLFSSVSISPSTNSIRRPQHQKCRSVNGYRTLQCKWMSLHYTCREMIWIMLWLETLWNLEKP